MPVNTLADDLGERLKFCSDFSPAEQASYIIRNDGVGGSNPSCGTIGPNNRKLVQRVPE